VIPSEVDTESLKPATLDPTETQATTVKPSDEVKAIHQLRVQSATEQNLRVECEDIHKSLLEQEMLIANSVTETLFWCKPFSPSTAQHLLRVERSLLTLLFSFDRISNIISKLVHLKTASPMVEVAASLHNDFTQLTREVYYVLEESHRLTEKAIFFAPVKVYLPFPLPTNGTETHPTIYQPSGILVAFSRQNILPIQLNAYVYIYILWLCNASIYELCIY
jgi:hypothetical protein